MRHIAEILPSALAHVPGSVQCYRCAKFDLRKAGAEFARLGLGRCPYEQQTTYRSATFRHECDGFSEAGTVTVSARATFLNITQADEAVNQ